MKLFLSPIKPKLYLGAFLLLCLATPLGRLLFADGGLWTMAGAAALCFLFAAGGAQWQAMDQLGASFNRWMDSAAVTALVAAAILGPLTAASAVLHQFQNPRYSRHDLFLITSAEPVTWVDAYGKPSALDGAAQDFTSISLTVLLHFVVFLTAALVGLAIGLALGTRLQWLVVGGVLAAGFLGVIAGILAEDAWDLFRPYTYVVTVNVAGAIALATCAVVFTRTRRFVR